MNNVEKRLAEEKKRLDTISAPVELESKLRNALNTATRPSKVKRITRIWKVAAVALFFMISVSYHYNAFAFYGKKLLGFEEVLTGTLKELNDEGMGQIVEQKTVLEDGTEFTVNGIIADANQFVMYYTLTNPDGVDDRTTELLSFPKITGFLTNSNGISGMSQMNEAQTEIKGTMSFEPVSPFSKELTIHVGPGVEKIIFPYNPNEAMQNEIKQSIKKTIKVDKGEITFKSIKATPTMTVIDGTFNVENFDRVNFSLGGIQLIANGTPIELTGSGTRSSLQGSKFDIRYDALPKQLESLQLVVNEFVGYQKLDEKISISTIDNEKILLDGKELWINKVVTTAQGVEITIATDDDVMLEGVSIESEGESTSLKTTINQNSKKQNGREMKERTLLFETTIEPEFLLIEGFHYMKPYNKVIEIPID